MSVTSPTSELTRSFTGSAGTALIPADADSKALLFVDSRYWIQAEHQVLSEHWKVVRVGSQGGSGSAGVTTGWMDFVVHNVAAGSRIGTDPRLISYTLASALTRQLKASSATASTSASGLIATPDNLVDRVRGTPERSLGPINPHPLAFSGETTTSKLKRLRLTISNRSSTTSWIYLLPALPPIAWLLNVRCPSDIPFCPVAYAYLLLSNDRCVVFVDERKIGDELREILDIDKIEIRPYGVEEVGKTVLEVQLGTSRAHPPRIYAPQSCSWALADACKAEVWDGVCPVEKAMSVKNAVEQEGMRQAYLRDGRAMVRWIAWLEQKIVKDGRQIGEWVAAQGLTRYRRLEDSFAGLAYEDISGSGPNSAIPHYVPHRGQERPVDPESTYVIDSGAQYLDGTIDTTRTLFFGKSPPDDVKRAYTRVLQGHMAVSTQVFPRGMPSDYFNMLARGPLFAEGLQFGHGIGHGVGSYLGVHEYPVSYPHSASFEPGHVTTIEPGCYKEGQWGMRIESALLCRAIDLDNAPDSGFLGWERLTQVPIQTSLVDWSVMSKDEIRWLNDHNSSVEAALLPLLQEDQDKETRDWLKKACKPHRIWPWSG